MQAIATLKQFENDEKLKINIFYWADEVASSRAAARANGAGTTAWPKILQNIKATKATNVLIMTDGDIALLDELAEGRDSYYRSIGRQYGAKYGAYYTTEGCV